MSFPPDFSDAAERRACLKQIARIEAAGELALPQPQLESYEKEPEGTPFWHLRRLYALDPDQAERVALRWLSVEELDHTLRGKLLTFLRRGLLDVTLDVLLAHFLELNTAWDEKKSWAENADASNRRSDELARQHDGARSALHLFVHPRLLPRLHEAFLDLLTQINVLCPSPATDNPHPMESEASHHLDHLCYRATDVLRVLIARGGRREALLAYRLMDHHYKRLRDEARSIVRWLGDPGQTILKELMAAVESDPNGVRTPAAEALASMGPKAAKAEPALVRALDDADREQVPVLLEALGKIGASSHRAIRRLTGLLGTKQSIRGRAAEAIRVIGRPARSAVPALVQMLAVEKNAWAKGRAADALGTLGRATPEVLATLERLTQERPCREIAFEALGRLGKPALPALLRAVRDPARAWLAADALGEIGAGRKEVIDALVSLLGDRYGPTRARAVKALGKLGPAAVRTVPQIIDALKDRYYDVRYAAHEALGQISPHASSAVVALAESIARPGRDDTWKARFALAELKGSGGPAVPILMQALGHADERVRADALAALRELRAVAGKKVVRPTLAALRDPSPRVRYQALWTARCFEGKSPIPAADLRALLTDPDADVRENAVGACVWAEGGPSVLLPELVACLDDPEKKVRAGALMMLGEIGPPARDALPALGRFLTDADWWTRYQAAFAVIEIDPPATYLVPVLVRLLREDGYDWALCDIALALAAMGPAARSAVPDLRRLGSDEVDKVRAAATRAIKKIDKD